MLGLVLLPICFMAVYLGSQQAADSLKTETVIAILLFPSQQLLVKKNKKTKNSPIGLKPQF
jgi:hypothetical protein